MTTYSLMDGLSGRPGNGPSAGASYTGNFLCGTLFKVTQGGMWLNSYRHWVTSVNPETVARKFALWAITGNGTGTLVSAATVTSGTLSAGWNVISLASPMQLAIGTAYLAATGWSVAHGFPDSDIGGAGTGAVDSFGTGGHTAGITNGPLFAFSDNANGGTKGEPYGMSQGVFSVAGTDASVTMPTTGSNAGNFWVDVVVSDTAPAGYTGSYRLWPNKSDTNGVTVTDAAVNYDVATEFHLSQSCSLNKIWYYSPSGTTQRATSCTIWSILGANSGTAVAQNLSPTWSGAAGSGWISCSFAGVTLPAGSYKVSVYNGAGTPTGWNAKDANTDYWRNGAGANGITSGPLSAPNLANASLAYNYNGNAGGTPPFSDGTTLKGQPTFTQGPPDSFPYLFAPVATPTAGSTQNYWVDVEVTPLSGVSGAVATITLTAPAGSVSASSSVAGPAAALVLAAPAGAVTASSAVAGATAHLTLGALAGTAAAGTVVNGITTALAFAAAPGSVSASSSVAGVPAVLPLAAQPGAASGTPVSAVLALTAADTALGTLTAGTQRTGGPG